jgi:hypothetical protein
LIHLQPGPISIKDIYCLRERLLRHLELIAETWTKILRNGERTARRSLHELRPPSLLKAGKAVTWELSRALAAARFLTNDVKKVPIMPFILAGLGRTGREGHVTIAMMMRSRRRLR